MTKHYRNRNITNRVTFRVAAPMLQIAQHTDYAARIVVHLACLERDAQASIPEIARVRLLPVPFVRRLIGRLVKAGIVTTVRGAAGGIRLARPPAEISLLDLVQAMEGPVALGRCVDGGHACPFSGACPVQCAWADATRALVAQLSATRFDALAGGSTGHRQAHQHAGGKHPGQAPRSGRSTSERRRNRWTS